MRTRVASLQQSPSLTVAFIRGLVEPVAVPVDAVLLSVDDVLDPRGDISRRLTLTPSPIDLDAPFPAAAVAAVDERDRAEMSAREVESLMNFLHLSTHGYRMQVLSTVRVTVPQTATNNHFDHLYSSLMLAVLGIIQMSHV